MISPDHLAMLAASGITEEFAMARGYETITEPTGAGWPTWTAIIAASPPPDATRPAC